MGKNYTCCVILLAAGKSSRFNSNIKKQFYKIKGKTLLEYSLDIFLKFDFVKQIIITIEKNDKKIIDNILNSYKNINVKFDVTYGGEERYNSVANSVQLVGKVDYILIHDVARPLIDKRVILECIKELKNYDCVIPAVKPIDTVKVINKEFEVIETLDRNNLVLVHTPQFFKSEIVKYIYSEPILSKWTKLKNITDDSQLAELEGFRVKVVVDNKYNIKVTTKDDIEFINFCLGETKNQYGKNKI